MSAAQYIGICMIAAPFIAVFVCAVKTIGAKGALGVFGITAAAIALFGVGATLMGIPP